MDKQIQRQNLSKPDYKKIYWDIIRKKFPDKEEMCEAILEKKTLTVLDVLQINTILFGKREKKESFNKNHRCYDKESICTILQYQKLNGLNNSQLASKFRLSRNTITKWKRMFESQR